MSTDKAKEVFNKEDFGELQMESTSSSLMTAAVERGYADCLRDAQAGRLKGYGIYTEEQVRQLMIERKAATIRTIRRLRGRYNLPDGAEVLIRDIETELDV